MIATAISTNGEGTKMIGRYLDTFGKRLRLLREDLGLTQGELAEKLREYGQPVGQSYISELERTDKMPSGAVVAGLAEILGCTSDFLLLLSDATNPIDPNRDDVLIIDLDDPSMKSEISDLVARYQRMPRQFRQAVTEFIRLWITQRAEIG